MRGEKGKSRKKEDGEEENSGEKRGIEDMRDIIVGINIYQDLTFNRFCLGRILSIIFSRLTANFPCSFRGVFLLSRKYEHGPCTLQGECHQREPTI